MLILFVYCFFIIIWAWYDMISQLNHKLKYVVWHFTSKSWKSKRPVTRRRTTVMNSTTTIPLSKKPIWNDWQSFGENYECWISGACDPWNIHEQCSIKTKLRKIHTVFCCWQIVCVWVCVWAKPTEPTEAGTRSPVEPRLKTSWSSLATLFRNPNIKNSQLFDELQ